MPSSQRGIYNHPAENNVIGRWRVARREISAPPLRRARRRSSYRRPPRAGAVSARYLAHFATVGGVYMREEGRAEVALARMIGPATVRARAD